MSNANTAVAAIEVACDPQTAFEIFTGDIGTWWKRGTYYWNDPGRGIELRFEPYLGGRLMEVYDAATGEGFEIGRVQVWEPGKRPGFGWRTGGWAAELTTYVDVQFTETETGTTVTIEHSGWDRLGDTGVGMRDGYARGWAELLGFFAEKAGER